MRTQFRFAPLAEMGSPCGYQKSLRKGGFFGTRNGNRTHNYPLGGGYYIHLTMQAYLILGIWTKSPIPVPEDSEWEICYILGNYFPAVIFAISSAKFSSLFWMPSPFSKR